TALHEKGRVDDAIAAYEAAIRLAPTMDLAHCNLGIAWYKKGRLDRAIAAYSRAIELNASSPVNRYQLGLALQSQQDGGGASAAYREAIRLDPDYAEAHCNLGSTLQEQGLFAEALAARERGHQLGSRRPDWRYPSAEWVKDTQRQVALDAKLPGIRDGTETPATAKEHLDFALVCRGRGL